MLELPSQDIATANGSEYCPSPELIFREIDPYHDRLVVALDLTQRRVEQFVFAFQPASSFARNRTISANAVLSCQRNRWPPSNMRKVAPGILPTMLS